MGLRGRIIETGLGVIAATRAHPIAARLLRGMGAILMFHHVRSPTGQGFSPNGLLDVTPDFLDAAIRHLGEAGYAILTLDDALARLRSGVHARQPFAVLTFDDGYRDNRDLALPILQRHGAPATFYVTTGYADRTARLWWVELEEAIRRADRVCVTIAGERLDLPSRLDSEKRSAFEAIYWRLRRGPEQRLLETIGTLCAQHGVGARGLVARDCMDWAEIEAFARHPLVTIGAHCVTHPMLAKHSEPDVRRELVDGKAQLEARLGRPIRHLAYPVGDRTSAGPREFALARELGYASAVTTRPGLVFRGHSDHLTALPRVSMNGNHQTIASFDVLLSGAAFALWNRGRRVDAA